MLVAAIGEFKAGDGFHYYTIIIDKYRREIYALQDYTSQAAEMAYLRDKFSLEYYAAQKRFKTISSGTAIDMTKIPKKYSTFKILL